MWVKQCVFVYSKTYRCEFACDDSMSNDHTGFCHILDTLFFPSDCPFQQKLLSACSSKAVTVKIPIYFFYQDNQKLTCLYFADVYTYISHCSCLTEITIPISLWCAISRGRSWWWASSWWGTSC